MSFARVGDRVSYKFQADQMVIGSDSNYQIPESAQDSFIVANPDGTINEEGRMNLATQGAEDLEPIREINVLTFK